MHEAAEGLGVDDPVPVTLELVANPVGRFGSRSAGDLFASPGGRAEILLGVRGTHAGRREPEIRAPGVALPGAWARTWARTTRRTASPSPLSERLSRIGCSIRVLSPSRVPGGIGKASPVDARHSGQSTPPRFGAK